MPEVTEACPFWDKGNIKIPVLQLETILLNPNLNPALLAFAKSLYNRHYCSTGMFLASLSKDDLSYFLGKCNIELQGNTFDPEMNMLRAVLALAAGETELTTKTFTDTYETLHFVIALEVSCRITGIKPFYSSYSIFEDEMQHKILPNKTLKHYWEIYKLRDAGGLRKDIANDNGTEGKK